VNAKHPTQSQEFWRTIESAIELSLGCMKFKFIIVLPKLYSIAYFVHPTDMEQSQPWFLLTLFHTHWIHRICNWVKNSPSCICSIEHPQAIPMW
jgi:hypothetical protein